MVDLLRKFIKADRLGDWDLHFQSLYEMLPFFAASGVHSQLKKIATGVTAPPHVNVHDSKNIGKHILASREGNKVASYMFRKKDQAVTMDTKSTIKIQDEYVHVDPQLLFQRLLTVGTKYSELQNVLDHELSHNPLTPFD